MKWKGGLSSGEEPGDEFGKCIQSGAFRPCQGFSYIRPLAISLLRCEFWIWYEMKCF